LARHSDFDVSATASPVPHLLDIVRLRSTHI
jgi:hypothetical protein